MIYEENQINEIIRCPYCKNKCNDPRIIECGASFCMQCIELLIKEGENGFKCIFLAIFMKRLRNDTQKIQLWQNCALYILCDTF